MRLWITIAALGFAAAPATARTAPPPGIWANPANSVHVAFRRCGEAICGRVVWANAKAAADAAAGGTAPLVGAELFRDFVEEERGLWAGEVFVPDIGQSLSGTVEQVDARTLVGEGCLFAGFGCRSQTWKRIK